METFMPFNRQMTATEDTTVHLGSTNLILLTQRTGPLCLETAPFWDYIQALEAVVQQVITVLRVLHYQ